MTETTENASQKTAPAAEATTGPALLSRNDNGVLRLTLNRPERMNSLSEEMMAALKAALESAATDDAVRVVVLDAVEGKVFCAGHDLKELTAHRADADRGRAYFTKIMDTCAALMQQIVMLPKPVIAAVDGVATAAG